MEVGSAFDLGGQIGRGSGQEPGGTVGAQRQLSLSARLTEKFPVARVFAGIPRRVFRDVLTYTDTVPAAAIPLRESAPGRRTGDPYAHPRWFRVWRLRRS